MPQSTVYSTRFQGSKRRLLPWFADEFALATRTPGPVLDAFAGSGVVAYLFGQTGWQVTANDLLLSSTETVRAFLGNQAHWDVNAFLADVDAGPVGAFAPLLTQYEGVFYPDEELRWLAQAAHQLSLLGPNERALAFWPLAQAALAKRPYNLFHRANLAMRERDVVRSFGNKATWEKSFPDHMRKFAAELDRRRLPYAPRPVLLNKNVQQLPVRPYDIVYLDPPYARSETQTTDYLDFYGFLDLLLDPRGLKRVNQDRPHHPVLPQEPNPWADPAQCLKSFERLFDRFQNSDIIVSYRSDGYPSPEELGELLQRYQTDVRVAALPIQYALARTRGHEILLLGSARNS